MSYDSDDKRKYTVLTEEKPSKEEIKKLMSMININIGDNCEIKPNICDNKFKGVWELETSDIIIKILLFKGKTASVDYMLFEGFCDVSKGDAGKALVILESTKTCDDSSRNTSVLQRLTKFIVYDKMYPNSNAIKVMFYCDDQWKKELTPTANFGMRLMLSLNIQIHTSEKNCLKIHNIKPFNSIDELIKSKNDIKQKKIILVLLLIVKEIKL